MPKGGWTGRRQHGQGKGRRRLPRGVIRNPRGEIETDGTQKSVSFYGSSKNSNQDPNTAAYRQARKAEEDKFDLAYGFDIFDDGPPRLGWLLNMLPTSIGTNSDINALELFFLQQDGTTFKCHVVYRPYFYVILKEPAAKYVRAAAAMFQKRFESTVADVQQVHKIDLDMPNHWNNKLLCLKLSFHNVQNMLKVRKLVRETVAKNKARANIVEAYEASNLNNGLEDVDIMETLVDMREYDVPYYTRVSIDMDIKVGSWYTVRPCEEFDKQGNRKLGVAVEKQDIIEKAQPRVLAFDIECAKEPLKFPDAERDADEIYMISYMQDGQGYLIINREIVTSDIDDFEYTPKPDFPGPFTVFNEDNEFALIQKFFSHCKEIRPNIYVTYNGDWFDWPYIETRAKRYGLSMEKELGIFSDGKSNEYRGRCCVHIDCLYWVKRDSYLPAGSRGLKAVTKSKLGYDPVEVDPEDMLPMAKENPLEMASYSVSDAVATYYLYDKYINLFIFSLCTIIPMGSEDVLRKGSGTLCEMLLMIEAFKGNIICPNKQSEPPQKFTLDGRLLDSETYVGGHVECLESGVYRDDLPNTFNLDPKAFDELISNIDRDLQFAIEVEGGVSKSKVENYEEVKNAIVEELQMLRDNPSREEEPRIYHLDVSAMYPNIILTNRLQPSSIVDDATCAACVYNKPDSNCRRKMDWMWRGEVYPATKSDYLNLKSQIEYEKFDGIPYHQLPTRQRASELKKRMKGYCQTVYRRVKDTEIVPKKAVVCQRENPFYVNTVKAFRDRRYEYKGLTKKWAKEKSAAVKSGDSLAVEEAAAKVVVYDSLQLAHKCILNSFYGYVMRKGARWHSMEMAAITTHTGGNLIKEARQLVERVGRPLELDTDGIWCILPKSFPEDFTFQVTDGKPLQVSYPCVMLNCMVHENFTNHQYQDLVEGSGNNYKTHSECSIYFEVDGPYKCMVIPASQEEGKLLKKRYAVFNFDGSIAELKGFELKRRGELNIVKIFQSQCFPHFLNGESLESCYQSVAEIANQWLEVLFSRGGNLSDAELIDLISENRSMSKSLEEYGDQKGNAITTAKRLSAFLGKGMVKGAGTSCKLLIAAKPKGTSTSSRAIPCAIFGAEQHIRERFLRQWTGSNDYDLRDVIDWDYYIDRLGACIMKIISIPAALQEIDNPVPLLTLPPWVEKMLRDRLGPKQKKITNFFVKGATDDENSKKKANLFPDIEDLINPSTKKSPSVEPPKSKTSAKINLGPVVLNPEDQRKRKADETAELPEDVEVQNFDDWLKARKQRWRTRLREKREGKHGGNGNTKSRTIDKFISKNQQKIMSTHWQIVDVAETSTKGLFKMTILSGNQLIQVYVSCSDIIELISTVGCVARPYDVSANLGTRSKPFSLPGIKRLVSATCPYLQEGYKRAFLYHCGGYNKHLVALFLVESGNFDEDSEETIEIKGQLVPAKSKCFCWTVGPGNTFAPNFRNILEELTETDAAGFSNAHFKHLDNIDDCYARLKATLRRYSSGTTILLAQVSHKNLLRRVIQTQYPVVFMPFDTNESTSIPGLQFQNYLARLASSHYIRHTLWWKEHIEAARYGHVPVSLMGEDYAETIFTCFYARMLKYNRIPIVEQYADRGRHRIADDGFNDVSTTSPGVYRTSCVEIELGNIAVNAIIEAEKILEYEGATLDDFAGEMSGSGKSFKVLRSLVVNWISDAKENGNKFADVLINNLYRIIVDTNSKFYSYEMHGFVDRLVKKLFMQLLVEIKRLGANVVHASKSKIIICTTKANANEAAAFFEYLKHQIQEKKIFSILYLEKLSCWPTLLFMDDYNWCAVDDEEVLDSENPGEIVKKAKTNSDPSLLMNMEIQDSLTQDCQDMLKLTIGDFLLRPYKKVDELDYVKKLVQQYIQQKVMEFINHQEVLEKDALNLLNLLIYLLCLDKSVSHEALIVKRNCLKLMGIQEFSSEAQFQKPGEGVVLRNVTCQDCWYVEDLNPTRDPFLRESEGSWSCKECESHYNMERLEALLVKQVQRHIKQYLQADLQCSKCSQVRNNNTSTSCPDCSGRWELQIPASQIRETINEYQNVAEYYGFEWLEEEIKSL